MNVHGAFSLLSLCLLVTTFAPWFHCNFSPRAAKREPIGNGPPEVLARAADDGNWTIADEGITD